MTGLLFSQMEPPADLEAEFHDWYNTEHIPARMAVPGFSEAVRYEALEGTPRFLACYFLESLTALETPEYRVVKEQPGARTERMLRTVNGFTRYLCEGLSDTGADGGAAATTSGSLLFVAAFAVPDEAAAEFDAWYEEEHVPLLMRAEGWLRVRRYRVLPGHDGPSWTHLALHQLRDASALDSPERAAARSTAWRDRLAESEWFNRSGRWVYRPIHAASAVTAPPGGPSSSRGLG
jgi:hypothetical protein